MASAIESLLEACERRTGEVGLLTLRNHADKRQAYFYLREGKIYAIQVDGLIPPIYNRLVSTGRVTMLSDLESAIRSAGGEDSLQLPFIISQRQLADEDDVAEVVKDFFLEAAAEALAWDSVKASWKSNIVFNEYPIPPLEGGRLVSIVSSRSMKFQQVAEAFTSSYENVFNEVTVKAAPNPPAEGFANPEEEAVFRATIESFSSLGALMDALGLTRVSVMKHTYALWHKGGLDVFVNGRNIRQEDPDENEDDLVLDLDSAPSSSSTEVVYDEPIDGVGGSNTVLPIPETLSETVPVGPIANAEENESALTLPNSLSEDSKEQEAELEFFDANTFGKGELDPQEELLSWNMPTPSDSLASEESSLELTNETSQEGFDEDPFAYDRSETEVVEISEGATGRYSEKEEDSTDEDEVYAQVDEEPSDYGVRTDGMDEEGFSLTGEDSEVSSPDATIGVEENASTTEQQNAIEAPVSSSTSNIFAELQAMLAKAKGAVEESERKLTEVDSKLSEVSQAAENSRQEKKNVEDEIERLTSQISTLTGQLTEISSQLDSAEKEEAELKRVREEEEQKMAEFNNGLESLRSMMGR